MHIIVDSGLTTGEWETRVGEQFRALRIDRGLDQASLAQRASISRGAVANLERGSGTSLSTLIKVARALDRLDWFDSIDESAGEISPMDLLRAQRTRPRPRSRIRARAEDQG